MGLDPQLWDWASPVGSRPPTPYQHSLPQSQQETGFSDMVTNWAEALAGRHFKAAADRRA